MSDAQNSDTDERNSTPAIDSVPESAPQRNSTAQASARAEELVGTTISGRYRIDELLAMGGMGAVYRGEHVHMHKRVAIKVLHPMTESLPEVVARFRREAVAGAHVQHPNVAAATDFGELDDGSYFLVTELVRGHTLHERMLAGPIAEDDATAIVRQIASALEAIHDKSIVHRDVKPRNVMLTNSEPPLVKLIDFGLAKVELDRLSVEQAEEIRKSRPDRITDVGMIFGTIAYIAPESAVGMDAVDARADLYALGVIFYEMLAGKHLFDGTEAAVLFAHHRNTAPAPIRERAPGVEVHPRIESIVMRLLEKDPDKRLQTATEVIQAIDDARAAAGFAAATLPVVAPSMRPPPMTATEPAPVPPPASVPASAVPSTGRSSEVSSSGPSGAASAATLQKNEQRSLGQQKVALTSIIVVLSIALVVSLVTRARAPETPIAATAIAPAASSAPATPEPPSAAAPDPSASASGEPIDLDVDPPAGSAALANLDTPALRRLLRRSAASKVWERAEQTLLALVDRDAAIGDETTRGAARDVAVTLEAIGDGRGDKVFEALEKRAGTDGLDVLFDIVQSRGKSKPALRAAAVLKKPDVQQRATPALRIALEIRDAPCDQKLTLLDRAVDEGDARAIIALETFANPCFKKGNKRVTAAIHKLKVKLGKP